jgi:hypothetical protein
MDADSHDGAIDIEHHREGQKYPKLKQKGLGDTVEKITHFFGLHLMAEKIARVFGKEDCGCTRRRDKLNTLIPYSKKSKNKS